MRIISLAVMILIASCSEPRVNSSVENNVRSAMPATPVNAVKKTQFIGLYEVQAGGNIFYSDASGRYLFVGHIYDLQSATDITQLRLDALKQEKHINE